MNKTEVKRLLKAMDAGYVLDAIVAALESKDAVVSEKTVLAVYQELNGDLYSRAGDVVDDLIEQGRIQTIDGL